jgi:putative ABC transport system permease protein
MPDWKPEIRKRLAGAALTPTRENAIIEELAQDLDDCYADWLARGASATEAYQQTLTELHGSEWLRRELQRVERYSEPIILGTNRRSFMIADLWHDLRYGARMLAKQPSFTLIAIVTLALGIGATTALFSVINGVLLRALPYRDEARIVTLWQSNLKSGVERSETSPANFLDWRARLQSCEAVAAAEPFGHRLLGSGEPEQFRSWAVTENFFEILGTAALYGRTFLPEEYGAGRGNVVVLGYGLWQQRFGGDPNLIGQTLSLNGQPHTVVGVMPPEFQYPPGRELWAPRAPRENDTQIRGGSYIRVVGKLKPGRTVAEAQAEMQTIAAQLAVENPQTNANVGGVALPLRETIVGQVRRALLVLFGAVGFVLLIACANIGGLLLARGAQRARELAIRAALGAGRSRLLRQLLLENLLLALLGGAFGMLLAYGLIQVLVALNPGNLPRLQQVRLDPLVCAFAAAITLLTALLFGLAPALQLTRLNLHTTLKDEGRSATGGHARQRLRRVLVVAEMALALTLLVGAGLLMRSFVTLLRVNPGFATANALTLETQIGRGRTPEQLVVFVAQIQERLRALPGVQAVGVTTALPFHDNQIVLPKTFRIADRAVAPGQEPTAYQLGVTHDYFATLGVPLLRGRALTAFDTKDSAPVALINQTLAHRHWPLEDPLGKQLSFASSGRVLTCEIVGVVGDVRPRGLDSEPQPEIYLPYAQEPFGSVTWLVRTTSDPAPLLSAVKEKIRAVNPTQTFASIATLEQWLDRSLSARRFNLFLLGSFAALALVLAGVGLYGLISFATAQRTHEIGIRMALGAEARDVLKLVIGQGMMLALLGIVAGLALAWGLTRLLQNLLFGVTATDPLTFVGVASLLMVVALVACWIPARRATKVDPMIALQQE